MPVLARTGAIAVILSRIRPEHSANVLRNLPNELSVEVVSRMLHRCAISRLNGSATT